MCSITTGTERSSIRLSRPSTVSTWYSSPTGSCRTSRRVSDPSTRQAFEINTLSTLSLLTCLASYFEERGQGTIAVISSVAGDRGRQSNYVYGSAKGAVTIFLQGLRNRLHRSGVNVITVKPGFVDTPMTSALEKGVLWATPEQVADRIAAAIAKGIDVSYAPLFWRLVMALIRSIPERLFKRMKL